MVIVYVRIYRAATRQMYALKTGQKMNVKAADGTALTLRIHRGGYHAVDSNETNQTTSGSIKRKSVVNHDAHAVSGVLAHATGFLSLIKPFQFV